MHGGESFSGLLIVSACSFIIPILLQRFRLNSMPVVVAEIIAGLIIGQSFLNIVEMGMWLNVLSTFGLIFLMFLSGLEVDFSIIKKKKHTKANEPNPLTISTVIFIGIFVLSYVFSLGFYYFNIIDNVFFMTLMISTISLGVVTPTLKGNNKMGETIGQIILLVAIIADIVTMILLGLFVGFFSEHGVNVSLFILLILAFFCLYVLSLYFMRSELISRLQKGTIHINIRAVFFLILVFVALSEYVGVENILGAFLAGVILSLISAKHDLLENLEAIGYGFFIPIFFVTVGIKLNLIELIQNPKYLLIIPLLLLALFLSKFLPSLFLLKYFSLREVFSSAALLTTTLSLVIAGTEVGMSVGVISESVSSIFILAAVLTCLIGPIIYKKLEPVAASHEKNVAFIGSNKMILATSLELMDHGFNVRIITKKEEKKVEKPHHEFPVIEIDEIDFETLDSLQVFSDDVVMIGTSNDELNLSIGNSARVAGYQNVIVRTEDPKLCAATQAQGMKAFSSAVAARFFLRSLIENPSVIDLITERSKGLAELVIRNRRYDGVRLREVSFLGDILIVRIYRGQQSVIPHGDTTLYVGDRLLVSGSPDYINELRTYLD